MKKCNTVLWTSLALIALLSAPMARAEVPLNGAYLGNWEVGTTVGILGAFTNIYTNNPTVGASGGGIGMLFDRPTVVTSVSIAWAGSTTDKVVAEFLVYKDGDISSPVGKLIWTSAAQDKAMIVDVNTGAEIPVTATWLTLMPVKTLGGSTSINRAGFTSISFNGPTASTFTGLGNLNLDQRITASCNRYDGTASYGDTGTVLNNVLYTKGTGAGDGLHWDIRYNNETANHHWSGGERSVTVFYDGGPEAIGSVGLSFGGNNGGIIPKWFYVTGSGGQMLKVDVNPMMAQYNRYYEGENAAGEIVSFESVFPATDWLKITFPPTLEKNPDLTGPTVDATAASNRYWVLGNSYGFTLTEFQAFAPIPEPATMSLLALGGVALLRRRK